MEKASSDDDEVLDEAIKQAEGERGHAGVETAVLAIQKVWRGWRAARTSHQQKLEDDTERAA